MEVAAGVVVSAPSLRVCRQSGMPRAGKLYREFRYQVRRAGECPRSSLLPDCVMRRPAALAAPGTLDCVLSSRRPHPQALSPVKGAVFQG